MLKRIALLNLVFFTTQLLWAQVTYTGLVVDENQSPLPGAVVFDPVSNKGSVTTPTGAFSLTLPQKTEKLTFSFTGFQSKTIVPQELALGTVQLTSILEELQNVIVYAEREYPIPVQEISKQELQERNLGQDIPMLLQYEPSVVSSSDAGNGLGYTYMRIRGSDQQRINVTINGIPLNDAESQGVFYVNLGDLASSVDQVTIQRGVGTSTNGAGAFGASVNMTTTQPKDYAEAQLDNSFGSFGTRKHTLQGHTGKLGEHFSFYGRLSKAESEGYIDKASVDLESYFLSAKAEFGAHVFTYNQFAGKEKTFQAWYGVPDYLLDTDRTFNPVADYDNETDNYQQAHYQLLYSFTPQSDWKVNAALHYTKGSGYFEQYQRASDPAFLDFDTLFSFYQLPDLSIGDTTLTSSDFIRRKWLDNDFYGLVFNVERQINGFDLDFGGGINRYDGGRFGELIWGTFSASFQPGYRFYDNESFKNDGNLYAKTTFPVLNNINAFIDLQFRRVNIQSGGYETPALDEVERGADFNFFNPKIGLSYLGEYSEVFGYVGIANKEPNLIDLYPNELQIATGTTKIREPNLLAERLTDFEVGYKYVRSDYFATVNLYHMQYRDQLVPTGQFNDVGFPTRTNVDNSFRQGIELVGGVKPASWIDVQANLTLSRNQITGENSIVLTDFSTFELFESTYTNSPIAMSPGVIAGSKITFLPAKGVQAELLSRYVGKQYLDNSGLDSRSLDPYFVTDLRLAYQFAGLGLKNIQATVLVNNLFSHEYESNGFAFPSYSFESSSVNEFNVYFPQAPINVLAGLSLTF